MNIALWAIGLLITILALVELVAIRKLSTVVYLRKQAAIDYGITMTFWAACVVWSNI